MLIAGIPTRVEEVAAEDLHVAGQHEQLGVALRAARASPPRPAACALLCTGHVVVGDARRHRLVARRSSWLEMTATISASSSPRRQRHSRSSRQWSWRETRIAMRRRSPHQRISQSISKRPATSPSNVAPRRRSRTPSRAFGRPAPGRTRCAGRTAAGGIGGVLVRGDDVRAPLEQEARHRGHDARAIRAADQQARGVAAGVLVRPALRQARCSPGRSDGPPGGACGAWRPAGSGRARSAISSWSTAAARRRGGALAVPVKVPFALVLTVNVFPFVVASPIRRPWDSS